MEDNTMSFERNNKGIHNLDCKKKKKQRKKERIRGTIFGKWPPKQCPEDEQNTTQRRNSTEPMVLKNS